MARKEEETYLALSYQYLGFPSKTELFDKIRGRGIQWLSRINEERPIHRQVVLKVNRIIREFDKFRRITNDLELYIDLYLFLAKYLLEHFPHLLGSSKTSLDAKIIQLVHRLYSLIGGLHPDYWMDYKADMDPILEAVHRHSSHLSKAKNLPRKFELV